MEYAINMSNEICDDNYIRYSGYSEDNQPNSECIKKLFDPETIKIVSRKITELLMGVDPQNRPIIVPDNTICSVISQVQVKYQPPVGDIHTRYIVPTGIGPQDYIQNIINQSIEIITSTVRTELEMDQNNQKLTIWTTVYGDFNEHQLRQHAPIKVLHKRPDPMQFNMNY
jgi:hypothetical protein